MKEDVFIGSCRYCGRLDVEIDLDFGGCVDCAKKYANQQKASEDRPQRTYKQRLSERQGKLSIK